MMVLVTSTMATVNDRHQVVRRGRATGRNWMVGLAILGPLLVFVAVWQLSGLGDDSWAIFAGWAGAVVVMATVLVAATVADRCRVGLRLGCVLFTLATMSGLVYWNMSGGLGTFKLQRNVSSWQQAVDDLHGVQPDQPCEPPHPALDLAGLGPVSQVCPSSGNVGELTFVGSPPSTMLVYSPGPSLAPAPDDCVQQISGPWWQAIPIGPSLDCPSGFRFEGGA
jgi:hypothetical protein